MGDRTTVEITVLTSHAKQTFDLLKEYHHYHSCEFADIFNDDYHSYSYEDEDEDTKNELTVFIVYDVNYGNMDSESKDLCDLGIAHNVRWEHGCNYNAGRNYFRFNADGTTKVVLGLPDDDTPSVNVHDVLSKLDKLSVDDVKQYLKGIIEEFSEPSWLNQNKYGTLANQMRLAESN